MTDKRILTEPEVAAIREQAARRDPRIGGGYTWTTIVALCDTVEGLRGQQQKSNDLHRARYSNLREALKANYPTAEEVVGAALNAIYERDRLRAANADVDAIQVMSPAGIVSVAREHRSEVET